VKNLLLRLQGGVLEPISELQAWKREETFANWKLRKVMTRKSKLSGRDRIVEWRGGQVGTSGTREGEERLKRDPWYWSAGFNKSWDSSVEEMPDQHFLVGGRRRRGREAMGWNASQESG